MSYATYELSTCDGRPVYLLEIKYSGHIWRYTSNDNDLTYNTILWTAIPMEIGEMPSVTDPNNATIDITVPMDNQAAELFKAGPPSETVSVTVYSSHLSDATGEFVVYWKGRVSMVNWTNEQAIITSDSIFNAFNRAGLGPCYSRQCCTYIYSAECKVSKALFKTTGHTSKVDAIYVTVPEAIGKEDNWFAGGVFEYINNANGNTEVKMIRSSVGSTGVLTLGAYPLNLAAGQSVTIYPGCDHQLTTCREKFTNSENYRGAPYIPDTNPFGGTALY